MMRSTLSIIILLVSIGFAFFYVRDEFNTVNMHRDNIIILDQAIRESVTIKDLLAQTENTLQGIDPSLFARLATSLPESIDTVRLSNNIQHMGLLRGLVLQDIKVGGDTEAAAQKTSSGATQTIAEAQAQSGYKTTSISFSVTTTYDGFLLLLDDIEKNLTIMDITSLYFSPVGTDTGSGPPTYTYTLSLNTYALP